MADTDKPLFTAHAVRRCGTTILVTLLACALAAGTFVVGRWTAPLTPASKSVDARPPLVTVTAAERQITETIDVTATVRPSAQYRIALMPPPGVQRAVVTGTPVAVGATVNAGDVLAEISGRPIIALAGAVPAYRDLHGGDRGPDVKQLQEALRTLGYSPAATGVFDHATESAVTALYRDRGYSAPQADGGATLPAREVAFLPMTPVKITSLPGPVGSDPTGRVITAEPAGPGTIVAQLAAAASAAAVAGTPVVLQCGGVEVRGHLAAAGPAAPPQPEPQPRSDEIAGAHSGAGAVSRAITVAGTAPDLPNGTMCAGTGTVAITPGPVTAVPASAVYQSVDQGPVVRLAADNTQPIPVTIGRSGDGWLEIASPPPAIHSGVELLAAVTS